MNNVTPSTLMTLHEGGLSAGHCLVRGICAIALGLATIIWPAQVLAILIIVLGAYAVVDGVLSIWGSTALWSTYRGLAWVFLVGGILGVIFGLICLFYPPIAGLALIYLLGAWALVVGFMHISEVISLWGKVKSLGWMIVVGIGYILFGLILLLQPIVAGVAFSAVLAASLLIIGVSLIVLSWQLYRDKKVLTAN